MGLQEYVKNLQKKPLRQRERIAVAATGVSFAIILIIWLISFSEMNSSNAPAESNTSTIDQLKNLKDDMGEGKKSIQEMWSQLPSQEDVNASVQPSGPGEGGINGADASDNQNAGENEKSGDQQNDGIPPLP
ncbi:MAG: hypothetical protein WC831_04535 [Parcubacteria group bacterium]|jgi:hypothetical protein